MALTFDHLHKDYGDVQALDDLSFSVRKGEIFGYIGPNGAGKTTTIKILVGLLKNYTGSFQINGEEIKHNTQGYQDIGYLPQECDFQAWRTVHLALTTFGLLSGLTKDDLKTRIPEVLEQVGLEGVEKRKIKNLSGGMKQKLRLAQALLHSPSILILDEPMTGLDPASRYHMKQIIRSLADHETTIFLSSHILSDIEDIADRIGILHQGQLIQVGTAKELQNLYQVEDRIHICYENKILDYNFIQNLPEIEKIDQIKEKEIIVTLKPSINLNESLLKLSQILVSTQVVFSTFNLMKPNLEHVYLRLVGGGPQ